MADAFNDGHGFTMPRRGAARSNAELNHRDALARAARLLDVVGQMTHAVEINESNGLRPIALFDSEQPALGYARECVKWARGEREYWLANLHTNTRRKITP